MKTPFSAILAVLLFAGMSCNSKRNTTTNKLVSNSDNSMTSLDWPGTYQGILPCGDCGGLKTQLVLKNDLTYVSNTQYLGKSDSVFTESGKFSWNKSGNIIKLENSNGQLYQVGENVLFHLDIDGKRITGNLAEDFKLVKEKFELTGTYWKLIRLNGQPVKSTNREPFIKLNTDNSVTGNGSCNTFHGKYEISDGTKIKFSPFAMTRMACIGDNTEPEFMQVLEKTTGFALSSGELIFQDEYETSLAIFAGDFFNK